ncbi:ABC transporter substrate-binding protein [Leadbettera azotonutricia]|uniref:Putative extracellular solute-binding protein family 1 n=1 Tax=Leadbettera azotonutricia (strain ATCC BAA-888 / DSM 13862 / ZAS-9) TaxID=545695 RepID=F5Y889_LEAAZ|nr:sugar ABC transporter substrate-binding protein [Leadbettera azotonutricia]AEF80207.1 putative extracellular solute-binding protein family 1 [Leadbettera azotonutricia ZAS-9]
MKKYICLFGCFVVLGLFATCSKGNKSPDNSESVPVGVISGDAAFANAASLSGEITVWNWDVEMWKRVIIPPFNAVYPNIKVNLVNIPSDELKVKLLAALASGSGAPDVATLQGDDIVQFIDNGGLLDLTDRIAPVKDGFPAYKIVNDSDAKGRIYGVPMDAGPVAMFYRTDLFAKVGVISPPETWEEWLEVGAKLKSQGLYLHRATSTGDGEFTRMLVQQQGGSFFDAKGNATVDTPELFKALELQKKLVTSGVGVDASSWTPDYNDLMQGNQLATHIGAAWYMNAMMGSWPNTPKSWRLAPMPYFAGSKPASSNNGGSELVIPEQSKNKELAWAFVNFRCSTVQGRVAITQELGEFGCYMPAYEDPKLMNATIDFFGDQKVFQFFASQTGRVPTNFVITSAFSEVLNMIGANSGSIITGRVPLEKGIADMQTQATAIVAKYR